MENLTSDNILVFILVLLAAVTVWNTLWGGYKNFKDARKPSDDLKRKVDDHQAMLDRDNKRLRELEETNRLLLRAFSVMLEHEISGNHIETLAQVRNDINEYLINR